MEFLTIPKLENVKRSELLVLPFWKGKKIAEPAADFDIYSHIIKMPVETQDFKGKNGEICILYEGGSHEKRIALLGLGELEKIDVEKLRRAFANITKTCLSRKIENIHILLPAITSLSEEATIRGISEGLLIPNYSFDQLKSDSVKEDVRTLLQTATLIGAHKKALQLAEKYATICDAVYFSRDLVNGNADDVTPQYLADVARGLAKTLPNIKAHIFDKKRIEKEKMGLLLAVNRGSAREPAFIVLEYKGAPKSKDLTAIVGKGVTYDTGGLNLKPTGSMETMKCDMGGAAVALGTIYAAASLELKVNLVAVIPSTENCIGSKSFKPGDVYTSYSGKTIEIGNTDAEGRLILADALTYVHKHIKPTRIIDFATLTGAVNIVLGAEAAGLLSTDDDLADALLKAGENTFERLWRLPLYEEYKDMLKSDIADMKNIGGRSAGTITAAMFLKEFTGDLPWAHVDIASTAFLNEAKRYVPKMGTGYGIRLMIEFIEKHLAKEK